MLNVISSARKTPVKTFLKTTLLTAGIITSSVFVYAQNETFTELVINGVAISKEDVAGQYFDADAPISEEFRNRYLQEADGAYFELVQQEGESSDDQALRIARLYLSKQRALTGLEEYAAQYEAAYDKLEKDKLSLEEYAAQYEVAYDNLEKDKISLEEKVAMLELENARLLKQN